MAESPHKAVQLGLPVLPPHFYPDPPQEPYVEVGGAELALACGEDGPAGPCLTCRYSEGMQGKVLITGIEGLAPVETMKCRRGNILVLVAESGLRHGCRRWEREPGSEG